MFIVRCVCVCLLLYFLIVGGLYRVTALRYYFITGEGENV